MSPKLKYKPGQIVSYIDYNNYPHIGIIIHSTLEPGYTDYAIGSFNEFLQVAKTLQTLKKDFKVLGRLNDDFKSIFITEEQLNKLNVSIYIYHFIEEHKIDHKLPFKELFKYFNLYV